MKTTLAIAAMFLSAAYLTPAAHATGIPFTATTTLPATGNTYTSVNLNLTDGAGSITAYGFDGVFTTTTPPSTLNGSVSTVDKQSTSTEAGTSDLAGSSSGLGLGTNGGDSPYIGPEDAVVLDFASVRTSATLAQGAPYAGETETSVTLGMDIVGTGASDWAVYGFNGTSWVLVPNGSGGYLDGPMSPTGTFSVTTTNLYQAYLVGVTQDCSLTIDSVSVNYTPTGSVPEPGTFVMGGMALIALGLTMKRRARKA